MKIMKNGIRAATLALVMGCPLHAWPQEQPFQPAGPLGSVARANIANRLAYAAISLINPSFEHRPVPLYGYRISDLDGEILARILPEAAEANIRIAILDPPTGDETDYSGQAVQISEDENISPSTIHRDLFRFIDELNPDMGNDASHDVNGAPAGNGNLIAFSQPLRQEVFHEHPVNEQRFMASAGLWASARSAE